jgi:hypothetical protein
VEFRQDEQDKQDKEQRVSFLHSFFILFILFILSKQSSLRPPRLCARPSFQRLLVADTPALGLRAVAFINPVSIGAEVNTPPNQYTFQCACNGGFLRVLRLFAANQRKWLSINNLQPKPSIPN